MTTPIDKASLNLLAYLCEHAGGYHQRIWLDPKPVIRSLGISHEQLAADSAPLIARRLIRARKFAADGVPAAASQYCAIWLTGKGEDYMRTLRATSGRGQKLAGAAKEL